jgi:hypothetical protein
LAVLNTTGGGSCGTYGASGAAGSRGVPGPFGPSLGPGNIAKVILQKEGEK